MQTNIILPSCNNDISIFHKMNTHTRPNTKLSENALSIINTHYKNNYILIQYASENISYDGYNLDAPEIEIGTLRIILHIGYEIDKKTNTCVPVFQYDTFHFEYIIGKYSVPEYCIDENSTTYHNVVDINLF